MLLTPKYQITRDEQHVYTLDGKRVPGVTSICKILDDTAFDWNAAKRGTDVHTLCDDYDIGVIDYDVPEEYQGYLNSWISFKNKNELKIDFSNWNIEIMVGSRCGFCGTIDRLCLQDKLLLDIKTGVPQKTHAHQLHAYDLGAIETFACKRNKKVLVYLKKDGSYPKIQVVPHSGLVWTQFISALTVHNFKNGGKAE